MTIEKILALLLVTILLSCNSQTNNPQTIENKKTEIVAKKIADCNPYFQFDKVEHFFLDIDEPTMWAIYEKKRKSDKEKKELELLLEYTPNKLVDTVVLNGIEQSGFIKSIIPTNKFQEINEIFCEQKKNDVSAKACIAIFRDLLVFKRHDMIIGTAKICFSCNQIIMAGTNFNTPELNKTHDYERLNKILHGR